MELNDPTSTESQVEEKNIPSTPEAKIDVEEETNVFVTSDGLDPEEAAEDIESSSLSFNSVFELANNMLNKDPENISSEDIRRLRQQIATFKQLANRSEVAEDGHDDKLLNEENTLKDILTQIREKKAEYTAKIEAEHQDNLRRKEEIISEINTLAEDTDNVNRTFTRYRELQDEFNSIGDVPATEDTSVWRRFQEARERYSDNLKINKELRDYDFKKNLDMKQLLLSEAEKLIEEDVIIAYRRLQELHNKWRQIGPVAKEIREEIWEKFKSVSSEINKRYQAHFEERKLRETENEVGKTAICEQIENLPIASYKSFAEWDEATKLVIELQEKWRIYGFASRKANKELFVRFRKNCDDFFAAKAAYFQATRDELARNLEKKLALVEKAESLKDSTDWKAATEAFVEMQKQWKEIGSVAKKHSDSVWSRFREACDTFFEAKKKSGSSQRKEENENLLAKRALIEELDVISAELEREEAITRIKDIQERWKAIGHVPFREKDRIYEEFRAKINAVRDALNLKRSRERIVRFAQSISTMEGDASRREREKLARALENRRQELRTYENNLGFLSSSSKNGNSLLKDFERKASQIRDDIAYLEEKIKMLDSKK